MKTYRFEANINDGEPKNGPPTEDHTLTFEAEDDAAAIAHANEWIAREEQLAGPDTVTVYKLAEVVVQPVYRDLAFDHQRAERLGHKGWTSLALKPAAPTT